MIVVSDTSPISALLRIKQLDLLEKLYEKVIIPEAVERELLRGHCTLPSFVEIRAIKDTAAFKRLCSRLDPGEAEAIVLARELHADFILIDESLGRSVAVDACSVSPITSPNWREYWCPRLRRDRLKQALQATVQMPLVS